MAQETQYWSFKYIFGTEYSAKTDASEISPVSRSQLPLPSLFPKLNSQRTDGGGLDHVADGESLDRLVLGCASRAVGASNGLDVAAALLVTTAGISVSISLGDRYSVGSPYLDARFLTMLGDCRWVCCVSKIDVRRQREYQARRQRQFQIDLQVRGAWRKPEAESMS